MEQALTQAASRAPEAKKRSLQKKLEHRHESLLWNLDRTDPLHPLLSFLLLFQELAFAGDVAAVALREHILPHRRYRLPGDALTADRRLQRPHEHLPRDDRLELPTTFASLIRS